MAHFFKKGLMEEVIWQALELFYLKRSSVLGKYVPSCPPFVKKLGHFRPLFAIFTSFQQLTVNMFIINLANEWIRTAELWYWKRPLCQLSHNHFPRFPFCFLSILKWTIRRRLNCKKLTHLFQPKNPITFFTHFQAALFNASKSGLFLAEN